MSLDFDFTVTIDGVDRSAFVLAGGTIDYGRQGSGVSFSAPQARFDMLLPESNPNPSPGTFPALEKWQSVVIHVTHDGVTQWRRFTGRIISLDYSRFQVSVTAAGNTVDFQRFPAGETGPYAPRSMEIDTDRIEWLCDGAPTAVTIESTGSRRIRQIERNTPGQPLLDAILRVADDADALFMEDRLGVPRYRSRNFTLPSRYTLPHAIVDSDNLSLSTDAGDALSTVRVYYGEPLTTTGLQNYKIAIDTGMAVALGYDASEEIFTDLATPDGAQDRANQYLAQHSDLFSLPDIPLLMKEASGSEADDILDLQEGWPITVETLPEGWPVDTLDADIIGFTEIMHQTDYRIILHCGPVRDFEGVNDDDPIYPDGSLTGYDATGTEEIDGRTYRWCRWDADGSVTNTFPDVSMFVFRAAVAKGGDGGTATGLYPVGGGGGAGGFAGEYINLNPGTWPIQVGTSANDGDTVFYGTRLYRGGDGGTSSVPDGLDGGSGGGVSYSRASPGLGGNVPGSGVVGQGYDGYFGGGGAAGPASTSTSDRWGGDGVSVVIAGTTITFGTGGHGGEMGGPATGPGAGGSGAWLGDARTLGIDGVLYLRYRIG